MRAGEGGVSTEQTSETISTKFSQETLHSLHPAPQCTRPTAKNVRKLSFSQFLPTDPFLWTTEGLNLIRSRECPCGHCTKPFTLKGFLLPCLGLSFPFFPVQSLRFAHKIYLCHLPHSHHHQQQHLILSVEKWGQQHFSDGVVCEFHIVKERGWIEEKVPPLRKQWFGAHSGHASHCGVRWMSDVVRAVTNFRVGAEHCY